MNTEKQPTLWGVMSKAAVAHTLTYFVIGLMAFTLFNYTQQFESGELAAYMRPTTDPIVMAGVLFQPIRGVLFGLVFYLLRDVLLARKNGWLVAWIMLVIVGILSTFGPAPGSIEGIIYTKIGFNADSWGGLLEVLTQSLLLSVLTFYWVNHPEKKWLTWVLVIAFLIAMLLPALGLLVGQTV